MVRWIPRSLVAYHQSRRDLAIAHLARDCSLPDHKTICEMVCLSVGVLPNILEEQSIKFL